MKTFTIGWLNKCRCGNKSHAVKTARGNESALWDDDAVKCNSCGRGGVIQVCEGQARVLWETDEEMAEGKPMSTLTKEWLLKTIADLEEERDATPGAVNEDAANALAAMKLALASLEAKDKIPELRQVIYHFRDWNEGFPIVRFKADYVISWMLANYPPAQPAAVSVPDDVSGPLAHAYKELTPTFMRNHIDVFERYGIYPDGSAGIQAMRIALDGMNRRAAMLQGAEQTKHRAIVERIAEIIHGKVTDIDLLTVTVKSMKDKLQK
ncbi:hypothetical protein ACFGFP_000854 [Enterobacter hormaechei]